MSNRMQVDAAIARGEDRRVWHLDKTLSFADIGICIGLIISIIGMTLGGIFAFTNIKQDVAVQAAQMQIYDKQRIEDRAETQRSMSELRDQLRRIDDKLEKISDKVGASRIN